MFVKVIFHGMLKKICPEEYTVDANTPAEAIRGVTNQFRKKLIRRDGQRFICSVKECPRDIDLNSSLRSDELNIYPAFCTSGGSSRPGLMQTIIGAIIVTIGAVLFFTGVGTAAGAFMMKAGAVMMIAGALTYALSPKMDTAHASSNPESSKAFGNSGNTTKIGTRIPIGYGTYKVAGQYLSVNTESIDTKTSKSVKGGIWGMIRKKTTKTA
jgi:predicted phage tail protein